jgi:nitrite reductase (NADH) large subunit
LKVSGLPVFSAGNFLGGEGTSQILLRDPGTGLFKKLVTQAGKLVGAVLVGDTGDAAWYLKLIREGIPIAPFRTGLAFGEAFCGTPDQIAA